MLESELAAAVAGGVTSLVCPPDTDPVLDEPGLVEMLQLPRRASCSRAASVPAGRADPQPAGRGADRDGRADAKPAAWASARPRCRWPTPRCCSAPCSTPATFGYTVWLRPQDCYLGKGVAASGAAGHAHGPGWRAGGSRDHRPAHHLRADARHRRARAPVPPEQRRRRGAGARRPRPRACRVTCDVSINSLHLTDVDIGYFDSRMRLNPPLRQQRDRDALRAASGRRHHRRAGVRPHAGGRRRQGPALCRGRARRHRRWSCC